MNTLTETICAISTPPGIGGIAVARISGPLAIDIADKIWKGKKLATVPTHTAHLGTLTDRDGSTLDQAVATIFKAPGSFTGEDTVELSVHGSRYVQRELLETLTAAGARLAEPGEFTRRAFAAGHMDLAEAEAVADVIASESRAAHRIAMSQMKGIYSQRLASLRSQLLELASLLELELDFSEEDVEFASRNRLLTLAIETHSEITRLRNSFAAGQAIRDGIPVAIVGQTNAGKSSLLNTLLGDNRAIVSDIHGTTRDTIEETLPLGDFTFRFIDTAGIRDTENPIEQAGIERSRSALNRCRIAIIVIDPSRPIDWTTLKNAIAATSQRNDSPAHTIIAVNKTDIAPEKSQDVATDILQSQHNDPASIISISATTGQGIDLLKQHLIEIAETERGKAGEDILVTNARHAKALDNAATAMARVIRALDPTSPITPPHPGTLNAVDALNAIDESIPPAPNSIPGAPHSTPSAPESIPGVEQRIFPISGDLIAIDLREAIHHLAGITGDITTPDILSSIFTRFCIGK